MRCGFSTLVLLLAAAGVTTGCDQAAEERAAQQAAESVRKGNQALRDLSAQVKQGSEDIVEAAKSGGKVVGERLSDGAITARVKAALVADPSVDGLKIDVDTKDAIVTLSGTVSDLAQSARAEDIARRVDGVSSVRNDIATPAPAS